MRNDALTCPGALDLTPRANVFALTVGRPDRGVLIEMSGAMAGRVHCLRSEEVSIGRGPECTLFFDDKTLSRKHATIRHTRGRHVLDDAGSLNGCFVNRERIVRRVLDHGDRLRFASGVRLQFQVVTENEEKVMVQLYEASVKDGLTGLYNRRCLDERLQAEVAHARRQDSPLFTLIVDIDHFKRVNDTFGHLAGDEVIRSIADLVKGQVRCEDLVARYGGEEFVLVVRNPTRESAGLLAERLRKAVEAMEVLFDDQSLKVTVSIGVSGLCTQDVGFSAVGLLADADQALYQAKDGGRNRVVCSDGTGVGEGSSGEAERSLAAEQS